MGGSGEARGWCSVFGSRVVEVGEGLKSMTPRTMLLDLKTFDFVRKEGGRGCACLAALQFDTLAVTTTYYRIKVSQRSSRQCSEQAVLLQQHLWTKSVIARFQSLQLAAKLYSVVDFETIRICALACTRRSTYVFPAQPSSRVNTCKCGLMLALTASLEPCRLSARGTTAG